MPFLDVPASSSQSSNLLDDGSLTTLKLKKEDPDAPPQPRRGAKLQEVEFTPSASFVIKTQLLTDLAHPPSSGTGGSGSKLFINVTTALQVPEPGEEDERKGMIHCVVSEVRETVDKSGKLSLVIDTTLPTSVTKKAKRDKNYKQWLIQVALEKVEERLGVELNRDYTEPNIRFKGELISRRAVVPVTSTTQPEVSKPKIVEMDPATLSASPAPPTRVDPPSMPSLPVERSVPKGKDGKKLKPRHTFEIVTSYGGKKGGGFAMIIDLPEEAISIDKAPNVTLSLTPSSLELSTDLYELVTDLPRDVNVDSVLKPSTGGQGGAEWSVGEKALRIFGDLA